MKRTLLLAVLLTFGVAACGDKPAPPPPPPPPVAKPEAPAPVPPPPMVDAPKGDAAGAPGDMKKDEMKK